MLYVLKFSCSKKTLLLRSKITSLIHVTFFATSEFLMRNESLFYFNSLVTPPFRCVIMKALVCVG